MADNVDDVDKVDKTDNYINKNSYITLTHSYIHSYIYVTVHKSNNVRTGKFIGSNLYLYHNLLSMFIFLYKTCHIIYMMKIWSD